MVRKCGILASSRIPGSESSSDTVQDLAERFVDGRLSTEKLRKASDEELAKMLIQVKGIGKVSLRPCGYEVAT